MRKGLLRSMSNSTLSNSIAQLTLLALHSLYYYELTATPSHQNDIHFLTNQSLNEESQPNQNQPTSTNSSCSLVTSTHQTCLLVNTNTNANIIITIVIVVFIWMKLDKWFNTFSLLMTSFLLMRCDRLLCFSPYSRIILWLESKINPGPVSLLS